MLTVRGATASVARAAVRATEEAASVSPLYRIPFIDPTAPSEAGRLHGASLFFLDLLVNRFKSAGLTELNLQVARFRMKDTEEPIDTDDETPRRPSLRAVRFEGDYLLGSVQACQLLAVEQRPLTDIQFQVVSRNRDKIIMGRFPVRVVIDSDHVSVETSYGSNLEASGEVHSTVTACVMDEINNGFGNEDRLEEFEQLVADRAQMTDSSDLTDLLDEQKI